MSTQLNSTSPFKVLVFQICQPAPLQLGPKTGISKREAKLIFGWSQMVSSDEIKKRTKMISITFEDFLDALGRTADLLSPPTVRRGAC